MKHSDTAMDTQAGQFIAGAKPLGTVTKEMVVRRARELAVVGGRNGNDYTAEDFDQARRELTDFQNTEVAAREDSAPDKGGWIGEAGDRGKRAPVRPAKDEQTFAEDLVKQGVSEATHHSMVAGAQTSKERDQS